LGLLEEPKPSLEIPIMLVSILLFKFSSCKTLTAYVPKGRSLRIMGSACAMRESVRVTL
jgi:hypothetical protein